MKTKGLGIKNGARLYRPQGCPDTVSLLRRSVANDTDIPVRTVQARYKTPEDALVGFQLPPFRQTSKCKPITTSRFYFLEMGVIVLPAEAFIRRLREGSLLDV
jgi:hypothetical protein